MAERRENNQGFAKKLGESEVKLLQKTGESDLERLILGTSEGSKDGFNQNLDLSCPHIKIIKAAQGTGSEVISALGEKPIKEEVVKLKNFDGTTTEYKVYYFRCSECKGEIPRFIPANVSDYTMAEIQEFNANIFKMASVALQTEMSLRIIYDAPVNLHTWAEGAEPVSIPTGAKLIDMLRKLPHIRVGRFTVLQALKNLADAAGIMAKNAASSDGKVRTSKLKIGAGKGLVKASSSVFEAGTGVRTSSKKRFGQDVEGSLRSSDDDNIKSKFSGSKGSSSGIQVKE